MKNEVVLPKSVTRFYSNVQYAADLLQSKCIAFVKASELNDPFDPYFFFETDFSEDWGRLNKHIRSSDPAFHKIFRKYGNPEGIKAGLTLIKKNFITLKEKTYIFSTSAGEAVKPRDNLYLWGHYANGHRGVAIEFDTDSLAKDAVAHSRHFNNITYITEDVWTSIIYRDSIVPLTAETFMSALREIALTGGISQSSEEGTIAKYISSTIRTKSTFWKNENEWRLMWENDSGQTIYKMPISTEAIRTVYLGLRLDPNRRKEIVDLVRQHFPQTRVLSAERRHGDFGLSFFEVL